MNIQEFPQCPTHIISLGAGVQSSVMALMLDQGLLPGTTRPQMAIFADTGWEPQSVYNHLEWLQTQLSFPVAIVQRGNLKEDCLSFQNISKHRFLQIPYYLRNLQNEQGMNRRQCTNNYKIQPIADMIRTLWQRQRMPHYPVVNQYLGISTDEITRIKPSQYSWQENHYPLVDHRISRYQCQQWFRKHYPQRTLSKSACLGCPLHSNKEWIELHDNSPDEFADTVELELQMQKQAQALGKAKPYLHRDCIPLNEVVDNLKQQKDLQAELFSDHQDECDGYCFV